MKTKLILIFTLFLGLFFTSNAQKLQDNFFMQKKTANWQSYGSFKQAVLNYKLPITDIDRAKKNLDMTILKLYNLPPTPNMTFRNTMKIYNDRLYWSGQMQPIYITNPIGWYQLLYKLK
jgi:hypothetical protein